MRSYPSFRDQVIAKMPIMAFDKLDGSLIRAEWRPKSGFYKFGRKDGLLDHAYPLLLKAPGLVSAKFADPLTEIFSRQRLDWAMAYFEFLGDGSFAGQHQDDVEHRVVLIDVETEKGIIPPREFVKRFGHLDIPKCLYEGNANKEFVKSVQEGTLAGMTFEGVVCKGKDARGRVVMFKVKSAAWLDKLKNFCSGNEAMFNRLR